NSIPDNSKYGNMHTADMTVEAVRNGCMPFYPQYDKNNFEVVADAEKSGAKTDDEIKDYIVDQLKTKKLNYAIADCDNEISFPRNWFIWRGNALLASMKGHEYMLNHYLGTHHNDI